MNERNRMKYEKNEWKKSNQKIVVCSEQRKEKAAWKKMMEVSSVRDEKRTKKRNISEVKIGHRIVIRSNRPPLPRTVSVVVCK